MLLWLAALSQSQPIVLWEGEATSQTFLHRLQASPGTFGATVPDVITASMANWATHCTVQADQTVFETYVTTKIVAAGHNCLGWKSYRVNATGHRDDTPSFLKRCYSCQDSPLHYTGTNCTDETFSQCSDFACVPFFKLRGPSPSTRVLTTSVSMLAHPTGSA